MKKVFITGVTGQDGAYLAKLLIEKGCEVHGGVRRSSHPEIKRLELLGIENSVNLHEFELSDYNNIARTIREVKPDEFYNLAAQSFVGASWNTPLYTADIDAIAVLRILDSLRTFSPDTRFYQASTSEMFGKVQAVPQSESTQFYPRSPYGVAKVFAHYITVNYRESFGMHASSGILFNHESPLRGDEFVTRKITKGLALIACGVDKPLELGNMSARRDWGFAGDYVEGMWLMLQHDTPDDYVLATSRTITVREFFTFAAQSLGFDPEWVGEGVNERAFDKKSGKLLMKVNPKFFRPAEVDLLIGDASKAKTVLGWKPKTTVEQIAQMMALSDYQSLSGRC
jgi:GDPmannose 4,6-dehydratase